MPMVHEFGIMLTDPKSGETYNEYEPEKYGCVVVHDEIVECFGDSVLRDLPCFWCSVDRPEKGLAYCGITLIPPSSLPTLLEAAGESETLQKLLEKAIAENRFVIHYGL
ncbi:MAG: hypothetical protein J6C51_05725 [Clostridia bacterium]|nr:hypothetical protein [Clostridia bacterium]